jgi:predicted nucleic acid-binding protein
MIPTELIVDASVLVAAAIAGEPKHPEALTFLHACVQENVRRLVPAIIAAEVRGPIARRTGRPALAGQFFATLRAHPDFVVISIDAVLGDEAGEVASLQGIKGCDAVYIALSRSHGIPLITLDNSQQDRAPADVEVFTPEQALAKWWPS